MLSLRRLASHFKGIFISRSVSYFSSSFNCLDCAANTLQLGTCVLCPFARDSSGFQHALALACLILWAETFFHFRAFRGTGVLFRTVQEVARDMRHFLLMMVFTTLGFALAFYVLHPGQFTDQGVAIGWPVTDETPIPGPLFAIWKVYVALWLGEIETHVFEHNLLYLGLFMICSLFMLVVLLNLLISIIQSTVIRVQQQAQESYYKELASLMLEVEDTNAQQDPPPYLLFSTRRMRLTEDQEDDDDGGSGHSASDESHRRMMKELSSLQSGFKKMMRGNSDKKMSRGPSESMAAPSTATRGAVGGGGRAGGSFSDQVREQFRNDAAGGGHAAHADTRKSLAGGAMFRGKSMAMGAGGGAAGAAKKSIFQALGGDEGGGGAGGAPARKTLIRKALGGGEDSRVAGSVMVGGGGGVDHQLRQQVTKMEKGHTMMKSEITLIKDNIELLQGSVDDLTQLIRDLATTQALAGGAQDLAVPVPPPPLEPSPPPPTQSESSDGTGSSSLKKPGKSEKKARGVVVAKFGPSSDSEDKDKDPPQVRREGSSEADHLIAEAEATLGKPPPKKAKQKAKGKKKVMSFGEPEFQSDKENDGKDSGSD